MWQLTERIDGPDSSSPAAVGVSETGAGTARALVAAMLTFLAAWMVLRNLLGWHKSLLGASGRRKHLPANADRSYYQHDHYSRQVFSDSSGVQDWLDYDADDSDLNEAAALLSTDDSDRLFIIVPPVSPAKPRLALVVAVEHTQEDGEEIAGHSDDPSLPSDLSSLSSSSELEEEHCALLTGEVPCYETPVVRSSLVACYYYPPPPEDKGSNNDDESYDSFHSPRSSISSASTDETELFFVPYWNEWNDGYGPRQRTNERARDRRPFE